MVLASANLTGTTAAARFADVLSASVSQDVFLAVVQGQACASPCEGWTSESPSFGFFFAKDCTHWCFFHRMRLRSSPRDDSRVLVLAQTSRTNMSVVNCAPMNKKAQRQQSLLQPSDCAFGRFACGVVLEGCVTQHSAEGLRPQSGDDLYRSLAEARHHSHRVLPSKPDGISDVKVSVEERHLAAARWPADFRALVMSNGLPLVSYALFVCLYAYSNSCRPA